MHSLEQPCSENPDSPTWYCIRTKPRGEKLAYQVLVNECGFEAFCARIRYHKKRASRAVLVEEALFPGYIFSKFTYLRDYRRVMAGKGILKIVSFGGRPTEVREEIIRELRSHLTEGQTLDITSALKEGILVQIMEGPFIGEEALVTRMIPASRRVALLLNLLGQEREIEHSADQILVGLQHPLAQGTSSPLFPA